MVWDLSPFSPFFLLFFFVFYISPRDSYLFTSQETHPSIYQETSPFTSQETMPFYFPKKLCLFTFQETMPLHFPRNLMSLHFLNLFIFEKENMMVKKSSEIFSQSVLLLFILFTFFIIFNLVFLFF